MHLSHLSGNPVFAEKVMFSALPSKLHLLRPSSLAPLPCRATLVATLSLGLQDGLPGPGGFNNREVFPMVPGGRGGQPRSFLEAEEANRDQGVQRSGPSGASALLSAQAGRGSTLWSL